MEFVNYSTCSFLLAMVWIFPGPVFAQVTLAWKFQAGDQCWVEEKTQTKQILTFQGDPESQEVQQTRLVRYKVLEKKEDGSWLLEQKIEDVKITRAGRAKMDLQFLEKLPGNTLKITYQPPASITKVEGYGALVKAVAGGDKNLAGLVQNLMPEESFLAAAEGLVLFLPAAAVSPKQSWKTQSRLPLGPLGNVHCANTCTLNEVEKGLARISLVGEGKYVPPAEGKGPFKIPRGNLRAELLQATYFFAVDKGRLDRAETRRRLQGPLGFVTPAGNVDVQVRIEQTVNLRVREHKGD